jgi:hypothetical protein
MMIDARLLHSIVSTVPEAYCVIQNTLVEEAEIEAPVAPGRGFGELNPDVTIFDLY